MIARRFSVGLLLTALFTGSLCAATPADSGAEVKPASAPAGTDARIKLALRESVRRELGDAGLGAKLRGYSISPALIELRRFVEPGEKRAKTVCVVALDLHDQQRGLVANVHGNAASVNATALETLDAAAHSAVARLPQALAALEKDAPGPGSGELARR